MELIDFKVKEGLVLPALLIDHYNDGTSVQNNSYYETKIVYCQNRLVRVKYLITIENSITSEKSLGYEVLAEYIQCPYWDEILKDISETIEY